MEQFTFTQDVWSSFESRLRAYVRRRVDDAAADDVLGEILLSLARHREDLQAAKNPSGWMFRVAANAITDHYRRRSVEQRTFVAAELENLPETASGAPVDNTPATELGQCLVPLIQKLPAPYSDALLLTEIEGVTQTAAAKRLGLSNSGMKSRVQRGRAKLKQALLRCCEVAIDRRGGVVDYQPRSPEDACPCGPPASRLPVQFK